MKNILLKRALKNLKDQFSIGREIEYVGTMQTYIDDDWNEEF